MELITLQYFWYVIFIFSMFAYAALDGFDIGVGCLHLFSPSDKERRLFINAIGPVWDANSLWIIIAAGVLFAGFPPAFSVLFPIFYLPTTALVLAYILRAAAVEFRGKVEEASWRVLWDRVFATASYILSFGFGYIFANLIRGVPIDEDGMLQEELLSIFSPYSIGLGLFTTVMFMLHGALYLHVKLEGEVQEKIEGWIEVLYRVFLVLWISITMATLVFETQVTDMMRSHPALFLIEFIGIIGLVLLPKYTAKKESGKAFISSTVVIASMVINYAIGTFPNIIISSVNSDSNSLTIFNSSASSLTMHVLSIIAIIGVPFFLMYCTYTFKVFQGKVTIDSMSY
ncbi:MAG: cytochrome d ubiquinol oxidase subunit II [Chlamydia sp.]